MKAGFDEGNMVIKPYQAHLKGQHDCRHAKDDRKMPPWNNTPGLNDDTAVVLKSPF